MKERADSSTTAAALPERLSVLVWEIRRLAETALGQGMDSVSTRVDSEAAFLDSTLVFPQISHRRLQLYDAMLDGADDSGSRSRFLRPAASTTVWPCLRSFLSRRRRAAQQGAVLLERQPVPRRLQAAIAR